MLVPSRLVVGPCPTKISVSDAETHIHRIARAERGSLSQFITKITMSICQFRSMEGMPMLGSEFGQTHLLSLRRLVIGQLTASLPGSLLSRTPNLIGRCSSTLRRVIGGPTSRLAVSCPWARS